MSEKSQNRLVNYLAEHPRMMGVLFMLILLLTQAGLGVAGGDGGSTGGP